MDALLGAERTAAEEQFRRMSQRDRQNIGLVQRCLAETATAFFAERMHHDDSAYRRGSIFSTQQLGYPFFALYLIGGTITKESPRPDIDLLVATNMRYRDCPWKRHDDPEWVTEDDPVVRKLQLETHGQMGLQIADQLPGNYNLGVTHGKALIRLSPAQGLPIDLVYVKALRNHNTGTPDERERHFFLTEEEFLAKDVDGTGAALPRVVLYRAKGQMAEAVRFRD